MTEFADVRFFACFHGRLLDGIAASIVRSTLHIGILHTPLSAVFSYGLRVGRMLNTEKLLQVQTVGRGCCNPSLGLN